MSVEYRYKNKRLKPVDEFTKNEIIAMRQQAAEAAEQAVKWMPWLSGKVSNRLGNTVRRAYQQGVLTKPINELTDDELLRVRGIGPKSLEQIRSRTHPQDVEQ